MCLERVYKGNRKKEALAKLPKSGTYWKVCRIIGEKYCGEFCRGRKDTAFRFFDGWNKTRPRSVRVGYKVAFHAFCKKTDAKYWQGSMPWLHVVECRIMKKDITNIGEQNYNHQMLCVVTKRLWMPKPKKKRA